MNPVITPEIREVMQAVHYRPAVSIIMPYTHKINLATELNYSLKTAADKVEKNLAANYPEDLARLVMQKLRQLIKTISYDTGKKSIAIYVSPVFEKVLYLDMEVEEKILVDESFEIRDLVYSKKQLHKYLLLLLSAGALQVYLCHSAGIEKIISGISGSAEGIMNDAPEKVGNFSDPHERKEIIMEKFLHHADKLLDDTLHVYHLPLFIMGTDRILGHFRKITKHAAAVIDYIPGNYESASPAALREILVPYAEGWKKIKQQEILSRLEEAAGNKKLVTGIKDVWKEAMDLKGKLLVVEKNYMYPAEHDGTPGGITEAPVSPRHFSSIKDAVDDVIEKVLANGGDVEFVTEGTLKNFQQIALELYY